MRKLYFLLALSLVMVACDKEQNESQDLIQDLTQELSDSYWDKVISEMTRTDTPAVDVLNSLEDDEFWYKNASSNFFNKNGVEIEVVHQQEGALMVGDYFMRYVDDALYFIFMSGPELKYNKYNAEIVGDNNIKFSYDGKESFEWKIVAYDQDKIVIDTYNKEPQVIEKYGELLYSRKLYIRKVGDKEWENATSY